MLDIRQANTVEVGTTYLVPTLYVSPWQMAVPILEPEHDDIEIIKFPQPHWHIDWRFMTEAYTGVRMRNMICPHRGINLRGQPVELGRVTCPGHGLQFDVETGKLRRRDLIPQTFFDRRPR